MIDLIFDTETTGLPDWKTRPDGKDQPHLIELGMQLYENNQLISSIGVLVQSPVLVSKGAFDAHGITKEQLDNFGMQPITAAKLFTFYMNRADRLVAHNYQFDQLIMLGHLMRLGLNIDVIKLRKIPSFCTKLKSTNVLKLPGKYPGKYKWPTLNEAYKHLVDSKGFSGAHRALVDVEACYKVLCALENEIHTE